MGDIVGNLAHRRHQTLDLIEHAIEIGCELIELVTRAIERNAVRQVSGQGVSIISTSIGGWRIQFPTQSG